MKIYVINIAKNKERLARLKARMDDLKIEFERFEAIYGADLSDREVRRMVNRLHWWTIKGYLPRRGEIGAALSHQGIYKKMVEDGIEICAIFEDDICPDERLGLQLEAVGRWVDISAPQVVLLSNYTGEILNGWSIEPTKGDSSAEAYVLTRKAAELLIRANTPVCAPSDYWKYWIGKGLNLFHAYPTVIHPEWMSDPNYASDVTPNSSLSPDVRRMGRFRRLIWKFNRLLGRLVGWVVYCD